MNRDVPRSASPPALPVAFGSPIAVRVVSVAVAVAVAAIKVSIAISIAFSIWVPVPILPRLLAADPGDEWPLLAHDPGRSGATSQELRPPFTRKWYRLFPEEGILSGVQPIIADGKVFLGTLRGIFHAIDANHGKDVWSWDAGSPILHAPAVEDAPDVENAPAGENAPAAENASAAGPRKVFFGCMDGRLHALDVASGRPIWEVQTGAAVWNSPLPSGGLVIFGSRDSKLRAVDSATGEVRWLAEAGGPFLSSPALDVRSGRVYAASEDMKLQAHDVRTGRLLWRSEKLPGASFRGYYPVVAPDGSVLITTAPVAGQDDIEPLILGAVREVFGDFASWRHTKEDNDRIRAENFALLDRPETYGRELDAIRKRLEASPGSRTFFVLDGETGRERCTAPVVYAESMNGTGAPPVVTPSGKVVVKYQALLRSRYEHYSPFLHVGFLDCATGWIEPAMDTTRTYGWHDSLLLIHDEQSQLSVTGRYLVNTHQNDVNALDLETQKGQGEPWCRNVHEPKPGEAVSIWALGLAGKPLPQGKEWLARGTAVYGGGSAIDVAISVAGDSFYYLPTHELNAGAALIAYRRLADGETAESASRESPPPSEPIGEEFRRKLQALPWDWDTLATPRLRNVLEALPDRPPGTRDRPLEPEAKAAADGLSDAALDRAIWEAPVAKTPEDPAWESLRSRLRAAVRELLSTSWRPFIFPAGKHPREGYRFFAEPAGTVEVLTLAWPHLDRDLRELAKARVRALLSKDGPLDPSCLGGTGPAALYDPTKGAPREAYEVPEGLLHAADDIAREPLGRLHVLWSWAWTAGDWESIEALWPAAKALISEPRSSLSEDCRQAGLSGLLAAARLAHRAGDAASVERAVLLARKELRARLAYEAAYPRGGVMSEVPVGRTIFSRWRYLGPELGRFLALHAKDTTRRILSLYVDHHRPTWPLAWNVETEWRNEAPYALPTASMEIFAARALILEEDARTLERTIDIPWCRADEFAIRKMALTLGRAGSTEWVDVRGEGARKAAGGR